MNALQKALAQWTHNRASAPEPEVHHVDAAGAEACGGIVLAELIRLRERLEQAPGRMTGGEVITHLAPIVALARGELQERLRRQLGDEHLEVPGIVSVWRQP